MKKQSMYVALVMFMLVGINLFARELPRLPKEINSREFNYGAQKRLPDIEETYVSMSPEDLGDGLEVGTLDVPGAKEAIEALLVDDKAEKWSNLDSLLIWKDGKLIFEMYTRRGRVDAPHYTMSITKTITSVVMARAIQVGLFSMEDLDKPIVSFMPEIDRSKIKPGTETITLRDALWMKSGLRYDTKGWKNDVSGRKKQKYVQGLFEYTNPVTPETKLNKYTGINPEMTLTAIDVKAPGSVLEFFDKELMQKIGGIWCWEEKANDIPGGGAGLSLSSRTLLKLGTIVFQEGRYKGEQLLSPEYVKLIMNRNGESGFGYHFHHRHVYSSECKNADFISGIGAGGNYMSMFPDLNMVVAITAHGNTQAPLKAIKTHIIPLFTEGHK